MPSVMNISRREELTIQCQQLERPRSSQIAQKLFSGAQKYFSSGEERIFWGTSQMKIMWYGEYDVTYEWVQAEPRLEFMPMEASLLPRRRYFAFYVTHKPSAIDFSFAATCTNILLPELVRFDGRFYGIVKGIYVSTRLKIKFLCSHVSDMDDRLWR